MNDDVLPASQECFSNSDIIYIIASHLTTNHDIRQASLINREWYKTLTPMRVLFPMVPIFKIPSFYAYLLSNPRATFTCQALRIIAPDTEPKSHEKKAIRCLSKVLGLLSRSGGLKYFIYALHGERIIHLPRDAWTALSASDSLRHLSIEPCSQNWSLLLSCNFSKLESLVLFLDGDANASNSNIAREELPSFLQRHTKLRLIRLTLGDSIEHLDISKICLPELHTFLLTSYSNCVNSVPFVSRHERLYSFGLHTVDGHEKFASDALPNLAVLDVGRNSVAALSSILEDSSRKQPIRILQLSSKALMAIWNRRQHVAYLGKQLRCLEVTMNDPESPTTKLLEIIDEIFPELRELSLFIMNSSHDHENTMHSSSIDFLRTVWTTLRRNENILVLEVLGDVTMDISEVDIESLHEIFPPRLRYLQWRPFTFRIDRNGSQVKANRIELPEDSLAHMIVMANYGTTFYDHLKGDYVDRF